MIDEVGTLVSVLLLVPIKLGMRREIAGWAIMIVLSGSIILAVIIENIDILRKICTRRHKTPRIQPVEETQGTQETVSPQVDRAKTRSGARLWHLALPEEESKGT